uniref:Uncharacterized protein n=1 Tax=Oryza meridionalis TaxID=40149 RepID=A0A0E0F8A6_9ORYZ
MGIFSSVFKKLKEKDLNYSFGPCFTISPLLGLSFPFPSPFPLGPHSSWAATEPISKPKSPPRQLTLALQGDGRRRALRAVRCGGGEPATAGQPGRQGRLLAGRTGAASPRAAVARAHGRGGVDAGRGPRGLAPGRGAAATGDSLTREAAAACASAAGGGAAACRRGQEPAPTTSRGRSRTGGRASPTTLLHHRRPRGAPEVMLNFLGGEREDSNGMDRLAALCKVKEMARAALIGITQLNLLSVLCVLFLSERPVEPWLKVLVGPLPAVFLLLGIGAILLTKQADGDDRVLELAAVFVLTEFVFVFELGGIFVVATTAAPVAVVATVTVLLIAATVLVWKSTFNYPEYLKPEFLCAPIVPHGYFCCDRARCVYCAYGLSVHGFYSVLATVAVCHYRLTALLAATLRRKTFEGWIYQEIYTKRLELK